MTVQPMLASTVDWNQDYLERILYDPTLIVEEKLDGDRVMLDIRRESTTVYNRNGERSKHQARFNTDLWQRQFKFLDDERIVLDGEFVKPCFHAFDVLHITDVNVSPSDAWQNRKDVLENLGQAKTFSKLIFQVVKSARTTDQKLKLIEGVMSTRGEGIMVKHIEAPYVYGTRSTAWVKLKFTRTLDAIVTALRLDGKQNCTLSLVGEHGEMFDVGRASTIGKAFVDVGQVVEVRYLHAKNERLVQPVIMRRRFDKKPIECSMDQLV